MVGRVSIMGIVVVGAGKREVVSASMVVEQDVSW